MLGFCIISALITSVPDDRKLWGALPLQCLPKSMPPTQVPLIPEFAKLATTLRPITRDGGARLSVDGRLYESVRGYQQGRLDDQWGRFWR